MLNNRTTILKCRNNLVQNCKYHRSLKHANGLYDVTPSCIFVRAFQSFDVNQTGTTAANYTANTNVGGGSFYDAGAYADTVGQDGTDFDNEPPLLEELGINPNHIFQKVIRDQMAALFTNVLQRPSICVF